MNEINRFNPEVLVDSEGLTPEERHEIQAAACKVSPTHHHKQMGSDPRDASHKI